MVIASGLLHLIGIPAESRAAVCTATEAHDPEYGKLLQIFKIPSRSLDLIAVSGAVAILNEFGAPVMGSGQFAGVLDRTPILLAPASDLLGASDQSIEIPAVLTVHFLDDSEVREGKAVEHDRVISPHPRDAVDRETDGLEQRQGPVQEKRRRQNGPDERRA